MPTYLIDEVNRLFDELVHDPWRHTGVSVPARPAAAPQTEWAVEIPLEGVDRGDVSVATEDRRLTVTVRRRGRAGRSEEHFQQSFVLPEGTIMSAVDASFEDERLRIRVRLRRG